MQPACPRVGSSYHHSVKDGMTVEHTAGSWHHGVSDMKSLPHRDMFGVFSDQGHGPGPSVFRLVTFVH